jgi:hypothetical protein
MMRRPLGLAMLLAILAVTAIVLPTTPPPVAAADPYALESTASYDIRSHRREVLVRVSLEFRNTTPNPPGRFSVFERIQLAIHDEATDIVARDRQGRLRVRDTVRRVDGGRVHVATIELREPVRYRDTVRVRLAYVLPDGQSDNVRVRPSVAIFPAWSFGTSGEVSVDIPAGYEMRVDGDPLTEDGATLVSGRIADPSAWVALITAVAPAEHATHEATVPLEGGTADLVVRAFPDDEAWGIETLETVSSALPLIEEHLGLPYPLRGQLILVESVPASITGFGESPTTGTEIPVSFDQPPFTALHQVTHVWLPPALIEARWIGEGLASTTAAAVAEQLDIDAPFNPAREANRHADAAFPLDAWPITPDPDADAYGYAASWALIARIEDAAGSDAVPAVLARVAAGLGPYEPGDVTPQLPPDGGVEPTVPLTSRSFLDHLEAVTDTNLAPLFREQVLIAADVELLPARTDARAAFRDVVAAAGGWGVPGPVASAMTAWDFGVATELMADARTWLAERDALLGDLEAAGLSAPDRLNQAYQAYGGGAEAEAELQAEREVAAAYTEAAEAANAERSLIERLGLVGGPDPEAQLALANGRFAEGDLRESLEAVAEANRIVELAATNGIVRIVSLGLVVMIAAVLAIVLFRRRAYTAGR